MGLSQSVVVAVLVGGDWGRKGLRFAIQAVARVKGTVLVVAGRGPTLEYQTLASALGVGDRVLFIGWQQDTSDLLSASDVFLLPTAYETFSLATYEAAAAGLPLLACNVSGISDLLLPGENGWFVKRDAADIEARLNALARDPALRASFGRSSRERAASYSWDAMLQGYLTAYRSAGATN